MVVLGKLRQNQCGKEDLAFFQRDQMWSRKYHVPCCHEEQRASHMRPCFGHHLNTAQQIELGFCKKPKNADYRNHNLERH